MRKIFVALCLICVALPVFGAELFYVDVGTGSFKDRVSTNLPTNTGVVMTATGKGTAARFGATDDLDAYGVVSGVQTIALVIRPTADTKLLQNDGSDILEITGGSYSGTGMTATYVNNAASAVALLDVWQLVICEFSGGVSFATDLEIDVIAATDIAAVWAFDTISADKRTELYQEFLRRVHISKPIVTNSLTPVAQFDGIENYIDCGNNDSLDITGAYTLSIFDEYLSTGNDGAILGKGASEYMIYRAGGRYFTYAGTGRQRSSAGYNDGKFHHVATTWDGNNLNLYIDGALDNDLLTGVPSNPPSSSKNFSIGARDGSERTSGKRYDVGVWNESLNSEEIERLYRNEKVRRNAISFWYLNEHSGIVAHDSLGNNNGVIIGTQPHGQSNKDMILSWSANKHLRADGRTVSSGDLDGLVVASGSFEAKENSGGKYIECATNGTLQIRGVDLSSFVGNGYIKKLGGSLSAEAGQTVDDATNIAFADNTLTITLTAGQTLTGLVITPQE